MSLVIEKAPYGQPCNRCGLCCLKETCPLGAIVLRKDLHDACPALEFGEAGAICGLAAHPMQYRPIQTMQHGAEAMRDAALLLIGAKIGGCDSQTPDEPGDDVFTAHVKSFGKTEEKAARKAIKLWGLQIW